MERKYRGTFERCRPEHEPCDEFSIRHPKMQLSQRAKIFSPFAALKGFEEAIDEKLERYVDKRELTEEEQSDLDRILTELYERTRSLRMAREDPVRATVCYYVPCPDENHEAYGLRGSYETLSGRVWKVDPMLTKTLRIGDAVIEFADIAAIQIEDAAKEENGDVLPLLYGDVAEAAPDRGGGAKVSDL